MNPYDFVRIDWDKTPERHIPNYHEKFSGLSGEFYGKIIAETPIFIPQWRTENPKRFIKNENQEYIIPGSSLKGVIRSLVETVGNGCFLLFDEKYGRGANYRNRIPNEFKKCSEPNRLCIACRMFGTIQGSDVLKGKVFFNDAVATKVYEHDPIYTVTLMGPKPRHQPFYLDTSRQYIAGRKFYFHHITGIKTLSRGTDYNQYIKPLDAGSTFDFSVKFTNLEEKELKTLLYALVLEPDMRHKLGYAKPGGLGSVRIVLTKISLIDYVNRYTQDNKGITEYQGTGLTDYVDSQIEEFVNNKSITLDDLRRIWRWDETDTTKYEYPSQQWFEDNPTAPISDT